MDTSCRGKKNERHGDMPLPTGWEEIINGDKVFYMDHNTKKTTWLDPRDRTTKPETFADCVGDELPYGWDQGYDDKIGYYFIDHSHERNQLDDPRQQFKEQQQRMLEDYLIHAQSDLAAKREIYELKHQRLILANEEVKQLRDTLATCSTSRTSLNSAYSIGGTKYDPELLRNDVHLAKDRVSRLKKELQRIQDEMHNKERGVQTLASVEQKFTQPFSYNIQKAHEILAEIHNNRQTLYQGQKEKRSIMQNVLRMREEYMSGLQNISSPDVSTLSLPTEHSCMASQTDISGEPIAIPVSYDIERLYQQYNEALHRVADLQKQYSEVQEQVIPGQKQTDKDRLLLIQEKEQLLRELCSIDLKSRSPLEQHSINKQIIQLRVDLHEARIFNQQISARLKVSNDKQMIWKELEEATHKAAFIHTQIKSLSMSTLSSSSSSRGSLGSLSASSKGSLGSLSFTDVYMPTAASSSSSLQELYLRTHGVLHGQQHTEQPAYVTDCGSYPGLPDHLSVSQTDGMSNLATIGENEIYASSSSNYIYPPSASDIMSSLQPMSPPMSKAAPPPTYEQHIERVNPSNEQVQPSNEHVQPLYERVQPSIDPRNLCAKLSELTMNQQENTPHSDNPVQGLNHPSCNPTSGVPNSYTVPMPSPAIPPTIPPAIEPERTLAMPLDNSNVYVNSGTTLTDNTSKQNLQLADNVEQSWSNSNSSGGGASVVNPPLSPISESSSGVCHTPSGVNTRSVSAAVSDESMAGDSGVFEPSRTSNKQCDLDTALELGVHTPQIQVNLSYSFEDEQLQICIEQAKNLTALALHANSKVQIKVALLPPSSGPQALFCTSPCEEINNPKFHTMFTQLLPAQMLKLKTLDIHVWSVYAMSDERNECMGATQVNLADFDPKHISKVWYNVLSFKFMKTESPVVERSPIAGLSLTANPLGLSTNLKPSTSTASTLTKQNLPSTSNAPKESSVDTDGAHDVPLSPTPSSKSLSSYPSTEPLNILLRKTQPPRAQCKQSLIQSLFQTATAQEQSTVLDCSPETSEKLSELFNADHNPIQLTAQHRRVSTSTSDNSTTGKECTDTGRNRSLSFDSSFKSSFSIPPDESSDESTIISSQASTLTRNQGASGIEEDLSAIFNDCHDDEFYSSGDDMEQDLWHPSMYPLSRTPTASSDNCSDGASKSVLIDERSIADLNSIQDNNIEKCDAETNTDNTTMKQSSKRLLDSHIPVHRSMHTVDMGSVDRTNMLRRSKTFSPSAKSDADYICKLNRSGSDSNVKYHQKFERNVSVRRSVRGKKSSHPVLRTHSMSQVDMQDRRPITSVELELDYQASLTKLEMMKDDLNRLKKIQSDIAQAKAGGGNMPVWFLENEQLQKALTDCNQSSRGIGRSHSAKLDRRSKLLYKVTRDAQRLNKTSQLAQPDHAKFREKMAFFTTANTDIPLISSNEDDSSSMSDSTASGLDSRAKHLSNTTVSLTRARSTESEHV